MTDTTPVANLLVSILGVLFVIAVLSVGWALSRRSGKVLGLDRRELIFLGLSILLMISVLGLVLSVIIKIGGDCGAI